MCADDEIRLIRAYVIAVLGVLEILYATLAWLSSKSDSWGIHVVLWNVLPNKEESGTKAFESS